MTTAKTVGKPILATRWNCFLFKGTLAMQSKVGKYVDGFSVEETLTTAGEDCILASPFRKYVDGFSVEETLTTAGEDCILASL